LGNAWGVPTGIHGAGSEGEAGKIREKLLFGGTNVSPMMTRGGDKGEKGEEETGGGRGESQKRWQCVVGKRPEPFEQCRVARRLTGGQG